LRDGSSAQPLTAQSLVEVVSESSSEQVLELRQGGARFEVVPDRARQFVVRAGAVTVHVVGTVFAVELRGAHTWVQVTRGRVQVTWENGEQFLGAGEQNLFPGFDTAEDAAVPSRAPATAKSAADAFRSRARQHEYVEAFAVMQATPGVVGRSVDDLMLAADVARLSGHPAQAVPYLERVLREHESDPRAPLAAFTLGRTLFGLGRNQEASRAFARVGALAPASALAEDALARQVEAASRVGDRAAAQGLARQYLKAYPMGRRAAAVREQSGLQ
jgi:transmembrane sensor